MTKTEEAIKVVVRCRPFTSNEIDQSSNPVVRVDEQYGEIKIQTKAGKRSLETGNRTFTFDQVFGMESEQSSVFNVSAKSIIDAVMDGFNGTIFAYGQTGTGKSYTMEGPKQATMDSEGIVPRSARHIFNSIKEQSGFNEYLVRVSYLEIYNEEIRDLLAKNSQKKLALKENIHQGGGGGVYMPNLKQLVVKDLHELEKVLQIGRKNRSVGATKMNQESSRSHSILSIVVECQQGANLEQTSKRIHMGKLNLVDLAGSERQSKTESTGDRLKEGIKINLSLTALGNVISSLVDKRQTHVPYRDSKLTRLLQDSLGGNAKTVMIANIGPAEWNLEETMSTLRYAHRAKSIQNKPRINEDPKDAMLRQYQDEINRLKQLLKIKENEQKSENPLKDQDKIKEQEMVEEQNKSLAARAKYESVLQKQEEDLKQYSEKLEEEKSQQELLMKRIQEMESKILHGGVNLIEKVQELNKKSAQAKQELANKEKHAKAQNQKIDELLDLNEAVTEKYSTLEEELEIKNRRLKVLKAKYRTKKTELLEMENEFVEEREALLSEVMRLKQSLELKQLVIDSFIPSRYQQLIMEHSIFDELNEQWQIDFIEYTGNVIKRQELDCPVKTKMQAEYDENSSDVYISYIDDSEEESRTFSRQEINFMTKF